MGKDNLLFDFDRAEYYRRRFLSRGTLLVLFSILFFILGFGVARLYYYYGYF